MRAWIFSSISILQNWDILLVTTINGFRPTYMNWDGKRIFDRSISKFIVYSANVYESIKKNSLILQKSRVKNNVLFLLWSARKTQKWALKLKNLQKI